jgi:hypothetical protein
MYGVGNELYGIRFVAVLIFPYGNYLVDSVAVRNHNRAKLGVHMVFMCAIFGLAR